VTASFSLQGRSRPGGGPGAIAPAAGTPVSATPVPGWRMLARAGVQIPFNLAAPILDRVREKRGRFGMDGDPRAIMPVLEALLRPVPDVSRVLRGARCLELGPGRTANVAIALHLLGARQVTSIDVRTPPALTPAAIESTLDCLVGPAGERLRRDCGASSDELRARAQQLRSGARTIAFGRYDGAHIGAPRDAFDVVVSKSVLEHVAPDRVDPLLQELRRTAAPGALMSHWIDFRDHMHIKSDFETEGDWLEFLAYPGWLYRLMYSKRIVGVNRLRHREWAHAFAGAGFESVADETLVHPLPPGFSPARLRPPWSTMPPAEFGRSQAIMVLRCPS